MKNKVNEPISQFATVLRQQSHTADSKGHIVLEFATHKKGWALGGNEQSPWEKWIINVELMKSTPGDCADHKTRLVNQITQQNFHAMELMNGPQSYVPSMGNSKAEMEGVVDFNLSPDISPYKFSIHWKTPTCSGNSATGISQAAGFVGSAVKRILKDGRF